MAGTGSPRILAVRGDPVDVAAARALFEEYAASLGVDLAFQGFEEEMARFPVGYLPPGGSLLLGCFEPGPAGCVALRRIDPRTCEMKRLYVRPHFRGTGLGAALARAIMDEGRLLGYSTMRLDTLAFMGRARAIYEDLGFEPIEPYYDNPLPGTVYMEAAL